MWVISWELHSMLSLQYQSSLAWGFNHGNFLEEKAWFSLWHKHKQKGSGYDGGLSQHKHGHISICKIENCIIFGSTPPQYSKTRWRNYAYAYSSTFLLDIGINRRWTKPACAWVAGIVTAIMRLLVFMLKWTPSQTIIKYSVCRLSC